MLKGRERGKNGSTKRTSVREGDLNLNLLLPKTPVLLLTLSFPFYRLPCQATLCIYQCQARRGGGGGWGVGHRVRILTFSKKTLSKSPPLGKKCLLKVSVTIGLLLFCSLKLKDQCMTSDENPHPGDYFTVKFPGHPSSLTLIGALLRPSTLFWPEKNLCQPVSYLTNPFNTATPLTQKHFVASWNRINGAPLYQFNRLTTPGAALCIYQGLTQSLETFRTLLSGVILLVTKCQ